MCFLSECLILKKKKKQHKNSSAISNHCSHLISQKEILRRSKLVKHVFFNMHKSSLLCARLQAKTQLKPKQGEQIQRHDVMPLRVQSITCIFCPSANCAPAHLHHLPVLAAIERVELVGSDLVGRRWGGAVMSSAALRHVLLGPRERLLVSWGDGV